MVDLVKIRRKARKDKASAGVSPASERADTQPPSGEDDASLSLPPPLPGPELPPPPDSDLRKPEEGRTAGESPTAASSKLEKFREKAGRRRDAEAVPLHEGEDVQPEGRLELLTFAIAGEQYAIDIERIVEIVTPRPVTRIPNADSSVLGITSLRGTIVTLVDVRRKLRHPAAGDSDADTRVVVIEHGTETVGFVVDRVLRVVKATAEEIQPHPVVNAAELDESVRGVFRAGDALTILLDLDKLLDHRALARAL